MDAASPQQRSMVRRGLLSLAIVVALTGRRAQSEDLDQGKSGATLFAANCASV
jgi:hypothetical protein